MTNVRQLLELAIIVIPGKSDIQQLKPNTQGIYALINKVNDKYYIGSSLNLKERLLSYFQPSIIALNSNRYINRAIQEYNINSFHIVILEFTNQIDLHTAELSWINWFNPEYNITVPGYNLSQEHKDKISKALTGTTQSVEHRAARSVRMTGAGNPNYGKKHSDSTKELISLKARGSTGYAVEVTDLLTGIITSYTTITEVARVLKISRNTITKFANGDIYRNRYRFTINKK